MNILALMCRKTIISLSMGLIFASLQLVALAADNTWNATSGYWDETAKWSDGTPTSDDTVKVTHDAVTRTVTLTNTYDEYIYYLDASSAYNGTDDYVVFGHAHKSNYWTVYLDDIVYLCLVITHANIYHQIR